MSGAVWDTDVRRFFPIYDNDRSQLIPGYAPNATISTSVNTLQSRSYIGLDVDKRRSSRPAPVGFDKWTKLPSRNIIRTAREIEQRVKTLKSPMNSADLVAWWTDGIPRSRHPLEDAGKWCIDSWVLDGEGVETKLCAMIQGEFQERKCISLDRTDIVSPLWNFPVFLKNIHTRGCAAGVTVSHLVDITGQNSPPLRAQLAGWPATILSDTLVCHSYMSSASFDPSTRSLATHGVVIVPAIPSTSATGQAELVAKLRAQTRMNEQFAVMCLDQNGWGYEAALANFEAIKGSIPPEAFV
jgi:nuclear RNA export factor